MNEYIEEGNETITELNEKPSLTFRLIRGFLVLPIKPISISNDILQIEKDKINKKFTDFINEINLDGGYINLTVSNDGLSITNWKLHDVSIELLDRMH